jgi:hypothetical protein
VPRTKQTQAEHQIKLRAKGKIDRPLMRRGVWFDDNGIIQFPDGSCMFTTRDPRVTFRDAADSAPDLETARKQRAESWSRYLIGDPPHTKEK